MGHNTIGRESHRWTATLNGTDEKHRTGKNHGGTKELVAYLEAVVDGGANPVTARWYMGRSKSASVVYCTIWIHNGEVYRSGTGKAGGHGYCKMSAAFDDAMQAAGVQLTDRDGKRPSVGGVGSTAIHQATEALVALLEPEAGPATVCGCGY